MELITWLVFKRKTRIYFDKVIQSGTPMLISCGEGKEVVLMSKRDYNSLQETFHLMKSPKNAERLLKSIEADKKNCGDFGNKSLIH